MAVEESSSPSYQRRQALRQAAATNNRGVQASRPLTEYLTLAQRLVDAFGQAVDTRQVDAAYVYGLRLASLTLETLPRHPEWKQSRYAKEKRRLATQVDKTIAQMEILKQRMDAEELLRQQQQREAEENRQKLAEQKKREQEEQRQKREESQRRLEEERQRVLAEHKKEQEAQAAVEASKQKQQAIQQSAMEKLKALSAKMNKNKEASPQQPVEAVQLSSSDAKSSSTKKESTQSPKLTAKKQTTSDTANLKESIPATSKVPHAATNSPEPAPAVSPKLDRKMTPRSAKEQRTIDTLERAIKSQEARMQQIEAQQIPQLLRAAKEHLRRFRSEMGEPDNRSIEQKDAKMCNPHHQAALQCLARKKKLERQLEFSKTAIFQMETQIFMLENAMEDRQVQSALTEASQAMSMLQKQTVSGASAETFAEDLAASLTTDNGVVHLDADDEEELLEELEQLIMSPEGGRKEQPDSTLTDEEAGMLALPPTLSSSLPTLPSSRTARGEKEEEPASASTSSIRNLLNAVMG